MKIRNGRYAGSMFEGNTIVLANQAWIDSQASLSEQRKEGEEKEVTEVRWTKGYCIIISKSDLGSI